MHVMTSRNVRVDRRRIVNTPLQRNVVNGVGLGDLEGFDIGKMFSRLVHFTPRSFQPKNIFGAIGSATAFVATSGLSSIIAPKIFSANSKTMRQVGMGVTAAAGVIAGGVIAAPLLMGGGGATGLMTAGGASSLIATETAGTVASGGLLSTIGGGLSTIGSGLMTGIKAIGSALPFVSPMMSSGGGQQQQYMDPNAQAAADQQAYMAYVQQQQYAAQQAAQQQAAQAEYVRQQQLAAQQGYGMNQTLFPTMADQANPGGYAVAPSMDTALQLPGTDYVETSIVPGISNTALFVGGGIAVLGALYLFSGSDRKELAHV